MQLLSKVSRRLRTRYSKLGTAILVASGIAVSGAAALLSLPAVGDPLPPDASYRPLPTQPFDAVKAADMAEKPGVTQRQQAVLEQRYDLSDHPIPGVMMSGGGAQAGAGRRTGE